MPWEQKWTILVFTLLSNQDFWRQDFFELSCFNWNIFLTHFRDKVSTRPTFNTLLWKFKLDFYGSEHGGKGVGGTNPGVKIPVDASRWDINLTFYALMDFYTRKLEWRYLRAELAEHTCGNSTKSCCHNCWFLFCIGDCNPIIPCWYPIFPVQHYNVCAIPWCVCIHVSYLSCHFQFSLSLSVPWHPQAEFFLSLSWSRIAKIQ